MSRGFVRACLAAVAVLGAGAIALTAATAASVPERPVDDVRIVDASGGPRWLNVKRGGAIPEGALTTTHESRRTLRRIRAASRPGSCRWRDTDFVLRLADRYLRAGVPLGRRFAVIRTVKVNAWWYRTPRSQPSRGTVVRDPDGILSTYWECRGFAVNPVATTGRWLDMNADVSTVDLARALEPMGSLRTVVGHRFRVWEYYDVPEAPGVIRPGTSGMAQGRVAQVFATAYAQTGEVRYLNASVDALRTFTVSVRRGGARALVAYPASAPARPWFVERAFPGASPWRGAALNGFMASILNLKSTARELRRTPPGDVDPRAIKYAALADLLASQGSATLLHYMPLHDSGSWSYYGMLPTGYAWRTYLAPLNYHCYHLNLLRQLNERFPGSGYDVWQSKWTGYVIASGKVCPVK